MDVITDFNAANNREKIDLSGVGGITGFKDLKNNNSMQDGSDLVIDDLDWGDFIF